ncbi:MAG TPA: hypothetical protein V6D12_07715 [Candidatus Obscuribacterales bacterium]
MNLVYSRYRTAGNNPTVSHQGVRLHHKVFGRAITGYARAK